MADIPSATIWAPKGLPGDKGPTGDKGPDGDPGPEGPPGPGAADFAQFRIDLASITGPTRVGYSPRQSPNTPLINLQTQLDSLLPLSYEGFQVLPNKTIKGPDGDRFFVHGVQMFDYLFVSFEARTDYNYRTINSPVGKGPGTGISEPTYYARVSYKNLDYVEQQLKLAQSTGANFVRVGVEPAVMYASVTYVDPADGLTYPSDITMLDNIVNMCEKLGLAIQLQNSNDAVPTATNIPFLVWMATRYYNRKHVWINPANEINGTTADVNNPTVWAAEMRQYMIALRTDIVGKPAGTKFLGPIAIDPPGWATRIDLIATTLNTDTVFSQDPNLVINTHFYPQLGDSDFRSFGLRTYQAQWINYIGTYCILVGETGIDNFAGRYDPNLDPGVPSVDPTAWSQMQNTMFDFLGWCGDQMPWTAFNGVVGHMWFAYIPGMSIHDDNSMYRQDGTITTWGAIFKANSLSRGANRIQALRALGARYTDGLWTDQNYANDSVTNSKLSNMAPGTIKGRITAGVDDPEDLSSNHVLNIIGSLQARISSGAIGTPTFQVEGQTGSRAGAAIIAGGVNDTYVGFYNRGAGAVTGSIIGNGGTGITYSTVSDYRMKTKPEELSDQLVLSLFAKVHPIKAGWTTQPDAPEEIMFLAHEIQEAVPTAVTGYKDQVTEFEGETVPVYQSVDYGRITPILAAALKISFKQIADLEARLAALEIKS